MGPTIPCLLSTTPPRRNVPTDAEGTKTVPTRLRWPRRKRLAALPSCHVAQNALRAWAWALGALRVPLPEWYAPPAPAKLTPLLAAYCQYRRSHGGVAEATLQRDIETAKAFLARLSGGSRSVSKATVVDIDRFVSYLSAGISKRTVADRCSSLRAFLRFLRLTKRLRHDLAACVVSPRFPWAERPPRALPVGGRGLHPRGGSTKRAAGQA